MSAYPLTTPYLLLASTLYFALQILILDCTPMGGVKRKSWLARPASPASRQTSVRAGPSTPHLLPPGNCGDLCSQLLDGLFLVWGGGISERELLKVASH